MKKIISLILIVTILAYPLYMPQKEAQASESVVLPWVQEAVDGKYGPTLGAILAAIFSLVLVADTTRLAIKDWRDPTTGFAERVQTKGNQIVKDTWQGWMEQAKWIDDTSKSFLDVLIMGTPADVWDFIFPEEINIEINTDMSDFIKNYIADLVGVPELQAGTYDGAYSILMQLYRNIGIEPFVENPSTLMEISKKGISIEKKIVIYKDGDYYNMLFSRGTQSNNMLKTEAIDDATNNRLYTRFAQNGGYRWAYNSDSNTLEMTSFGSTNTYTQLKDSITPRVGDFNTNYLYNAFNGLIYSNVTQEVDRLGNKATFYANTEVITIDQSILDIISPPTEDTVNRLTVNSFLTQAGQNIDVNDLANTDVVANIVAQADVTARLNGESVLESQVKPVPVEDPVLDENWLVRALKGLLEWLFVPSQVVLDEFVANAQDTMNSRAGILTYPLTLVIQFLMAVSNLDTEEDFVISIPKIEYKGHVLYNGTEFNYNEFITENGYEDIQSIIYAVGNFIMIIGMLNMAKRKGDEIIRGI